MSLAAPAVPPTIPWKNAFTCAGSVARASLSVEVSGPVVGRVSKLMLPEDRLVICWAKVSTSKPLSKTTERSTALIRSLSLVGLVSVPTDRILSAAPRRKACCRFTRSRSPAGRPCRCRTKASAAVPCTSCSPAAKLAPDHGSSTASFRQTGTPPIALDSR